MYSFIHTCTQTSKKWLEPYVSVSWLHGQREAVVENGVVCVIWGNHCALMFFRIPRKAVLSENFK